MIASPTGLGCHELNENEYQAVLNRPFGVFTSERAPLWCAGAPRRIRALKYLQIFTRLDGVVVQSSPGQRSNRDGVLKEKEEEAFGSSVGALYEGMVDDATYYSYDSAILVRCLEACLAKDIGVSASSHNPCLTLLSEARCVGASATIRRMT